MNLTSTTILAAIVVFVLFMLMVQAAHPASSYSITTGPVLFQSDGPSGGLNASSPSALNQLVFSAVGAVVCVLSAAGLAVVIRRGNFL